MRKVKYKYQERYRGHNIMIYGVMGTWVWRIIIDGKVVNAPTYHFSIKGATNNAMKYIDKKMLIK